MALQAMLGGKPASETPSAVHRRRQRHLILFEAARDQGLAAAAALIARRAPQRTIWISNAPIDAAIPPAKAQRLLGGECDLLVIDVWSGFDADALAAAVGTLRGGGLLLLLAPELSRWGAWVDPEAARIATHPHVAADVGTRFLGRFAALLATDPAVLRPMVGGTSEPELLALAAIEAVGSAALADPDPGGSNPLIAVTEDQARAVDAILSTALGRAHRPLVLSSDRGRGKSAALGIATGRLIGPDHARTVIVTAPRRSAVDTLLEHARAAAAAAGAEQTPAAERMPRFMAPDALTAESPHADLLLVDEAAGIPAPLLEKMLDHYPRICFATTVHGYEGTGRGFDLRFRSVLERRTPGWRALRLITPIRWSLGDPIERLINRALLLDAEPIADECAALIEPGAVRFEQLARDSLAQDDAQLRQVFGLLMLGHYQTRPNDLRHLLDGPNLSVAVLSAGPDVLATALLAREGAIEQALHQPIFDGRRRPRGHLLPQTLSAHAGLIDAPALRFQRIVRIAVHPAARRRGLGRRLVNEIAEQACQDGSDLVGASFGATPGLLAFWEQSGLRPLHLGTHRNAASGARAAVVLRPLTQAGSAFCTRAEARLRRDLPILLTGPLRSVEPANIAPLLAQCSGPAQTDAEGDQPVLDAFAHAHRTLEASLPALSRFVWLSLIGGTPARAVMTVAQTDLLIRCALQAHPPEKIARELGLSGRAEVIEHLRETIRALRGERSRTR